jgi:putative acetyltransferase
VRIRDEAPTDHDAIRILLDEAFPGEPVARLVDDLRTGGDLDISLVAEIEGRVVGHIGFSPVAVAGCRSWVFQLSPLAVDAGVRRQGVGAALVRAGIDRCRAQAIDAILVLGDPRYYGRFGFSPAAAAHLRSRWSGPHFMALLLRPGALADCTFLTLAPAFERLP